MDQQMLTCCICDFLRIIVVVLNFSGGGQRCSKLQAGYDNSGQCSKCGNCGLGFFSADAVNSLRYLTGHCGNTDYTHCAYTPEIMAVIERIWGTIHNMASAMMIEKVMAEPYWEHTQQYACLIYNSVPPTYTPKGQKPLSPMEKFDGKVPDL